MNYSQQSEDVETLLYDPQSFVKIDSNVNPESRRHFRSRKKRSDGRRRRLKELSSIIQQKTRWKDGYRTFSKVSNAICGKEGKRSGGSITRAKSMIGLGVVIGDNVTNNDYATSNSKAAVSISRSQSDVGLYSSLRKRRNVPHESWHMLIQKEIDCEYKDDVFCLSDKNCTSYRKCSSGVSDISGTESENDENSGNSLLESSSGFSDCLSPGSESDLLSDYSSSVDQDKVSEFRSFIRSLSKNKRPESMISSRRASLTTTDDDEIIFVISKPSNELKCEVAKFPIAGRQKRSQSVNEISFKESLISDKDKRNITNLSIEEAVEQISFAPKKSNVTFSEDLNKTTSKIKSPLTDRDNCSPLQKYLSKKRMSLPISMERYEYPLVKCICIESVI